MFDLLGALIGILVAALVIPLVLVVVLFALALTGFGIALGLVFTVLGVFLELAFALAPFILIGLLLYWAFKPAAAPKAAEAQP
jgi:hypothetical protein